METVPPIAYIAFAAAFVVGISMFACLFLLTRRLGMTFERRFANRSLSADDAKRLFGTLWSGQGQLAVNGVSGLVWTIRLLYVAFVALVAYFIFIVVGASS